MSADFEDLLSGQGFNAHKDKKGPKTIAEMRKEEMAKEMDPEKLKVGNVHVYVLTIIQCLPFSLCWKLLETLSLKGGGDSKLPAVLHARQPSKSFRSCSARSYPPVLAVTSVRGLRSMAGSQGPGTVSCCFP